MQDVPAHLLEHSFSGPLANRVTGALETGRWSDVSIRTEGRRVRCYLDGKEVHNAEVPVTLGPSVYAAAGRAAGGDIVLRLVNASPVKQSVNIDLAGAGATRYAAIATHLTSKDLDLENSLAEPTRIAPLEARLAAVGAKFQYELEGNSFTILKLTPGK